MYCAGVRFYVCFDSLDFDPIFIGGEGRSGTTLLRVMLDSHSAISCGPESHFLVDPRLREFHEHFLAKWPKRAAGYGYGEVDMDAFVRGFVRNWFETYMRRRGKRRWADKTPQNIHALDYIWRLFPSAKFIHMIRDGRDVACSILPLRWGPGSVRTAAGRWVDCIEKGVRHREDRERYLEVRYEDLVRHPERETRRVTAFVGEEWEPCMLEYWRFQHDLPELTEESARQVSHPIHLESIGRWRRELSPRQLRQFVRIAGETLADLGYD